MTFVETEAQPYEIGVVVFGDLGCPGCRESDGAAVANVGELGVERGELSRGRSMHKTNDQVVTEEPNGVVVAVKVVDLIECKLGLIGYQEQT